MSEVKRLLEQIEQAYIAAQRALTSPSIMAPHEFITKRMEEIEIKRDELSKVIGDDFKATEMIVKRIEQIKEG